MRTLFGVGAFGDIIKNIQVALTRTGFDTKGTDGLYGGNTSNAVGAFQRAKAIASTGVMDDVSWQALMQGPLPSASDRSLQLTASLESHGFSLAVGNFDGALLTWGIIGFTLRSGQVQSIVLAVNQSSPQIVQQAFGPYSAELLNLMRASTADQESWAQQNTLSNGGLTEPWKSMFAAFGAYAEVQQEQVKHVQTDYLSHAIQIANRVGFSSELGLALCFDICVQNGGIKSDAMNEISQKRTDTTSEAELRVIVANAVADAAQPTWREDVRTRKLAIANGKGTVHGHDYVLENWGLCDQYLAAELASPALVHPQTQNFPPATP
jgi:peptidoglycan hydrolase-like protein with peptidoglycan-binding domain